MFLSYFRVPFISKYYIWISKIYNKKVHLLTNKTIFIYQKGCVDGWYGVDCKQKCSGHCKDDIPCNHITGQCGGGCGAGWRGVLCDKGKRAICSQF